VSAVARGLVSMSIDLELFAENGQR
jgi:hypothetical protein